MADKPGATGPSNAELRYERTPPDRDQRFEITMSGLTNEEANEVLTVLDRIQWRRREERLTVAMKSCEDTRDPYTEADNWR